VPVIEIMNLTKSYGRVHAVRDLTFTVPDGRVTGFLGPNGAGKTTTLRLLLGLNTPTSGTATINGRRFRDLGIGLRHVGALLSADDVHKGRTARAHLKALARSNALPGRRVEEVLDEVGLAAAARRRIGGFSLGMRQRLGIAAALLGDPPVLIFDEPLNGLDPEGVRWVRGLFRRLAAEGRTVFVSSHMMGEMEHTADRLVVIGHGRLVADQTLQEFAARAEHGSVRVRTPDRLALAPLLAAAGASIAHETDGALVISGLTAEQIAKAAVEHRIVLSEVTTQGGALEDAFMALTSDSVEYKAGRR
jgi:ABC-2 type transport system ATP-binding protein